MPTKKFLDLSEDKKKAFIDAAIMEFERQPFNEASIFNIAHNAGVSRTGVYYYFTNKQDIYEYLLSMMRDDFIKNIEQSDKMDIFGLFMKYFEYIAAYKGKREEKLIRQSYNNIKLLDVNTLDISIQKLDVKKAEEMMDLSNLKYKTPEVIKIISLMGFSTVSKLLNEYFSGKITYNKAKEECEVFFECLKNGFIKQK